MPQQVSCPGCHTTYKVADSSQGKAVKLECKKCGKVFVAGAGGAAKNTGVTAAKKPVAAPPAKSAAVKAKPQASVVGRPDKAPARSKSSSGCLIVVALLFVLFGMTVTGAGIGGYFLFFHKGAEGPQLTLKDAQALTESKEQKTVNKDKTLEPKEKTPEPKEKTPEPKEKTPEPKEKTPAPKEKTPEPKEKTPEPKEKTPEPMEKTPEPKEKTPEPKEKTPEPKEKTPEPKEKTPEPKDKPPVVVSLYQLKDPPTPPDEFKLDPPANQMQMVVTPDGKTAVVVSGGIAQERRVMIVDLPSGKIQKTVPMPGLNPRSMVLTPDGKVALIGGYDDRPGVEKPQRVYVWAFSLKAGGFTGIVKGLAQEVVAMSMSPDGTLLACAESSFGGPRGTIRVLNWKTGGTISYREKVHENVTHGVGLTPDKKYVISTGVENNGKCKIVVFDIAAKKEKYTIENFPGAAEGLVISADGKHMAAAINRGNGGSVRVWEIDTGIEKLALVSNEGNRGARRIAFGPDDKTVIATFYDATTRVFDIKTGNEEGGFYSMGIMPGVLATTPDVKTVLTAEAKEVRVWQFPDALMRLTKADQRPFAQAFLEGKVVELRGAGVRDDEPNFKTFTNATIEWVRDKAVVSFIADGAPTEVHLKGYTKFFNDMGMAVAAEDAGKVLRVGNQVNIKVKKEFNNPVIEVRLTKEGPAELAVDKLKLKYTSFPGGVTFDAPLKVLSIKFAPNVRYLDLEGKEIKDLKGFFNSRDTYSAKLKFEADEALPILYEIRTAEKGVVKAPRELPGAKEFKNATVVQIKKGTGRYLGLSFKGEEPTMIYHNAETKAYDMKGKEVPAAQIAKAGCIIDGVYVPREGSSFLAEARLVDLGNSEELAKIVEPSGEPVKNATVSVTKMGKQLRYTFTMPDGKSFRVVRTNVTKAYDADGKEVPLNTILIEGARVDARVLSSGDPRGLLEVRPAGSKAAPPKDDGKK